MEQILKELRQLLPTEPTKDEVLVLIQKLRMNLLLNTNTDEGDYDEWINGELEFGNISRYTQDVQKIIQEFLVTRKIFLTQTELEQLSEQIKNFTMNQNII